MRVGLVGLGLMGLPMAHRLLAAGHELTVHSRRKETARPVLERGAQWVSTPAKCGEGADVTITMLPDPASVETVVLGEGGLLAAKRPPSVLVDMSTSPPQLARRIAEAATRHGSHSLDAPVSGGPMGAQAGKLTIMVGGDEATFRQVVPVFDPLGAALLVGGHGCGQSVKLVNQLLVASIASGVADAWALTQALEIDPRLAAGAVSGGLGASPLMEWMWTKLLEEDLQPGFKVSQMVKDLTLATAEGERLGLDLAAGRACLDRYRWLQDVGGAGLGTQALVRHPVRHRESASTNPGRPQHHD